MSSLDTDLSIDQSLGRGPDPTANPSQGQCAGPDHCPGGSPSPDQSPDWSPGLYPCLGRGQGHIQDRSPDQHSGPCLIQTWTLTLSRNRTQTPTQSQIWTQMHHGFLALAELVITFMICSVL